MPTAKTIFEEIFDNEKTFQLFCSIAASGEAHGSCALRSIFLITGSESPFRGQAVRGLDGECLSREHCGPCIASVAIKE